MPYSIVSSRPVRLNETLDGVTDRVEATEYEVLFTAGSGYSETQRYVAQAGETDAVLSEAFAAFSEVRLALEPRPATAAL